MSRFTASILAATALLGVLLWVVVSLALELARAPEEPLARPVEVEPLDPALPRLDGTEAISDWLNGEGYDADTLFERYDRWEQSRGFRLTRNGSRFLDDDGQPQDDEVVLLFAARGDLAALHELAERSLQRDRQPLEALAWYDQAIVNGSIYAMLRTADLLVTLTDPVLSGYDADPAWREAVAELENETPPPVERALAWSLAAVIIGGYAVVDDGLAARIANLAAELDAGGVVRACEAAQNFVLDAAASRRALGDALFATDQPALAFTRPNPADVIPCDIPVVPLVSLDDCAHYDYVAPTERLQTLWVCATAD